MNINDPLQNLWLGKMQMEMGVQVTNGLLAEAKIEALQMQLASATAEIERLKGNVEAVAITNTALRAENEVLKERKSGNRRG